MMDDLFDQFDDVFEEEEVEAKKKPVKKEKSETANKGTSKDKSETDAKKFKYPFTLHYAAQNLDVSHIFDVGTEYTGKEVTEAMLAHQFYEFSGEVNYDFRDEENVLVPVFKQYKKG